MTPSLSFPLFHCPPLLTNLSSTYILVVRQWACFQVGRRWGWFPSSPRPYPILCPAAGVCKQAFPSFLVSLVSFSLYRSWFSLLLYLLSKSSFSFFFFTHIFISSSVVSSVVINFSISSLRNFIKSSTNLHASYVSTHQSIWNELTLPAVNSFFPPFSPSLPLGLFPAYVPPPSLPSPSQRQLGCRSHWFLPYHIILLLPLGKYYIKLQKEFHNFKFVLGTSWT